MRVQAWECPSIDELQKIQIDIITKQDQYLKTKDNKTASKIMKELRDLELKKCPQFPRPFQ